MTSTIHTSTKEAVKGPSTWFTGEVFVEAFPPTQGAAGATVTFTPGARTAWHTHQHGQILHILHGEGWICDRGGEPQRVGKGDVVHCSAGVEHWHGAARGSVMSHLAVGLGETKWLEQVTEEEYGAAQ